MPRCRRCVHSARSVLRMPAINAFLMDAKPIMCHTARSNAPVDTTVGSHLRPCPAGPRSPSPEASVPMRYAKSAQIDSHCCMSACIMACDPYAQLSFCYAQLSSRAAWSTHAQPGKSHTYIRATSQSTQSDGCT
eukprot:jgi/Ulvmu1/3022/UM015_0062.1